MRVGPEQIKSLNQLDRIEFFLKDSWIENSNNAYLLLAIFFEVIGVGASILGIMAKSLSAIPLMFITGLLTISNLFMYIHNTGKLRRKLESEYFEVKQIGKP